MNSEADRGTTFKIWVQCAETPYAADGPKSEAGDLPNSQITVLIVEDEDPLRQAVSKSLAKRGFSLIEARDGSAAMDAIQDRQSQIDVLVLDVTLPGAPSWRVLEEAKGLRPEMKVIVTSAYDQETAVASLRDRAVQFVRKPYRLEALAESIRRILS